MSEDKSIALKGNDPIPFDYPNGIEAAAEYVFNHITRDPESGKIILSGFEIDLSDTSNLAKTLGTYVQSIYWL